MPGLARRLGPRDPALNTRCNYFIFGNVRIIVRRGGAAMPFPSRFAAPLGRHLPFAACALARGASLAAKPADRQIVGTPQSSETYGCMLRKGDPPFKALVGGVLVQS